MQLLVCAQVLATPAARPASNWPGSNTSAGWVTPSPCLRSTACALIRDYLRHPDLPASRAPPRTAKSGASRRPAQDALELKVSAARHRPPWRARRGAHGLRHLRALAKRSRWTGHLAHHQSPAGREQPGLGPQRHAGLGLAQEMDVQVGGDGQGQRPTSASTAAYRATSARAMRVGPDTVPPGRRSEASTLSEAVTTPSSRASHAPGSGKLCREEGLQLRQTGPVEGVDSWRSWQTGEMDGPSWTDRLTRPTSHKTSRDGRRGPGPGGGPTPTPTSPTRPSTQPPASRSLLRTTGLPRRPASPCPRRITLPCAQPTTPALNPASRLRPAPHFQTAQACRTLGPSLPQDTSP